ncbi:unnamed protein product [Moneuplotes crassus]|uniref:Ubiquitin-like domain-containing protein n=1 Tax=Euplotes crassus TaxID=5936 RepID=A0AAD1Y4J6_EUPCR|nr:unnamed protein product [Moneuplotes crassus]
MNNSEPISVSLKGANNAQYTIITDLNETVADFKKKVEEKTHARMEHQKLAYKGKALSKDDVTLKDAEFINCATVHMMAVVKGGLF